MEPTTIYKITTEGDCEGRSTKTLGYATGEPRDIRAYFDKQKEYNLDLEKIKIRHISPKMVLSEKALLGQKQSLEQRMREVNEELERLGVE